MKKMNAEKARKKYFEYYVDFENLIRKICQKNNIVTKGISLKLLIEKLASLKNFPAYTIKIKRLQNQRNCRNWLSHTYKNQQVADQQLLSFKNIKTLNMILLEILKRK